MKKSLLSLLLLATSIAALAQGKVPAHPHVRFETTEGTIVLELDRKASEIEPIEL